MASNLILSGIIQQFFISLDAIVESRLQLVMDVGVSTRDFHADTVDRSEI
jgi:hypothetical protein